MRWKYFFLFILVLILLNITLFTQINTNKITSTHHNIRENFLPITELKYNLLNEKFGSSFIQSQYLDLNYHEKKYLENKFDSYIIEQIKAKNPSTALIRQLQNKTNITIINFDKFNIMIIYLTKKNQSERFLEEIIKEYKNYFNVTLDHYLFITNEPKLTNNNNIIFNEYGNGILDFWFLKNITCFHKNSQKSGIKAYFKFKAMKNIYPHFKDDIDNYIKDNKKRLNNIVLNKKDKFIYENNFKNNTEGYILTHIKGYLIWEEINKKHNITSMINNLNENNCKILNKAYEQEEKKLLEQLSN